MKATELSSGCEPQKDSSCYNVCVHFACAAGLLPNKEERETLLWVGPSFEQQWTLILYHTIQHASRQLVALHIIMSCCRTKYLCGAEAVEVGCHREHHAVVRVARVIGIVRRVPTTSRNQSTPSLETEFTHRPPLFSW